MPLFPVSLYLQILKVNNEIQNRLLKYSGNLEQQESGLIKQAFDTRRTNQETNINPRRNLQYYSRSEPFIGKDLAAQIKNLFKVKTAADNLKEQFLGEKEWFNSNCQILCNALDNTLRIKEKDYDFFKPQFDYMNELLYLRYRLASDDIEKMSEQEIKERLLGKDEKLLYKSVYANYTVKGLEKKSINISNQIPSADQLIQALFGNVKATSETKNVKRSVTITIDDRVVEGAQNQDKKR